MCLGKTVLYWLASAVGLTTCTLKCDLTSADVRWVREDYTYVAWLPYKKSVNQLEYNIKPVISGQKFQACKKQVSPQNARPSRKGCSLNIQAHLFWWQVTKQPALHQENTISAALLSTVGIFGVESPYHELALTVAVGGLSTAKYWRQIPSYTNDFKYKLKSRYAGLE